jgi:hypothetical protein
VNGFFFEKEVETPGEPSFAYYSTKTIAPF